MKRVPLLLALGIFLALTVIGATALSLIRHPPAVPKQSDYPHDRANPWGPR